MLARGRFKIIVIIPMAVLAILLVPAAPAFAWVTLFSDATQCANDGLGDCLYTSLAGVTDGHNIYVSTSTARTWNVTNNWGYCSNTDRVQSTAHGNSTNCPFRDPGLDSALWNAPIVDIQSHRNTDLCVGITEVNGVVLNSNAVYRTCGSGFGTEWVAVYNSSCSQQCDRYVSVRATNDYYNLGANSLGALYDDGTSGDLAILHFYNSPSLPGLSQTWCPAQGFGTGC